MKAFSVILIIGLLFNLSAYSQECISIELLDKKSTKLFQESKKRPKAESLEKIADLQKLLIKYPSFCEGRYLLSIEFIKSEQYPSAIEEFRKLLNYSVHNELKVKMLLGELYEQEQSLDASLEIIQSIKLENIEDDQIKESILRRIEELKFRIYAYEHPSDIIKEHLPPTINTSHDEYTPSFTSDNNEVIFTRRLYSGQGFTQSVQEDLYYSYLDDNGEYAEASPINEINTNGNEGTHCLSQDGKILIFTSCQGEFSQNGCDLYISFKKEGTWSKAVNMGLPINTRYWESHPCLSYDNQTLYFSSTRKGGYGKSDIWQVQLIDGQWSEPENLGPTINTAEDDQSPFIHPDDETLYFRSKGQIGMGGFDIFMSKQKEGKWSDAVNLSYPINTKEDESSIFINAVGNIAYISQTENGKLDLYSFNLPEEFKPSSVSYLKLWVKDQETGMPISCQIDINSVSGQRPSRQIFAGTNGKALAVIQTGEYLVTVKKDGYIFYSDAITLSNNLEKSLPFEYEIFLKSLPKDTVQESLKFIAHNIFFESNSAELQAKSLVEIKNIFNLMQTNDNFQLTIVGHTDGVGDENDNLNLSINRAKSVYKELIGMGLNSEVLAFDGKGEMEPIADNNTEEGRSKNRRTECIIKLVTTNK